MKFKFKKLEQRVVMKTGDFFNSGGEWFKIYKEDDKFYYLAWMHDNGGGSVVYNRSTGYKKDDMNKAVMEGRYTLATIVDYPDIPSELRA